MFGNPISNDKGWALCTMKDVCELNPSKKLVADISGNTEVSFLPMEDLAIHADYTASKLTRTMSEVAGSYTYFAENDVLLAKVTPCFENGKVGIARGLKNGIGFGSSEFFVFRPSPAICKEFIYFLVQTPDFISDASKQLTGTSGLRRIPRSFLENLQFGLPPIDLQLSFVRSFEKIVAEKRMVSSSNDAAKDLFSSRLDKYFNG